MIEPGQKAPHFMLADQDGQPVSIVIRQRRRIDGTYGRISIRGVTFAGSTPVVPA